MPECRNFLSVQNGARKRPTIYPDIPKFGDIKKGEVPVIKLPALLRNSIICPESQKFRDIKKGEELAQ